MRRARPVWMRGLKIYDTSVASALGDEAHEIDDILDHRVHARSRFLSVDDPDRVAVYSVRDTAETVCDYDTHTLVVVREFRRVPLHASGLALMLFTARPGAAAPVLGSLAHFVERAVSLFQPAYLLLAHSLEQPQISTLLMGVHECAALQAGNATAFSLDALLPDLRPLLSHEPECYAYCPEPERERITSLVSPYAV
ncbi:MAG TPA: hypothetical protein VGU22_10925 [Methylomirabilota bacterium]|nr:hypothetical protein [Methylomirabilota bacterium]